MDYNATKGWVDNLDKLVTDYSCKRRTLRWPLVIFFNILDISGYNVFVMRLCVAGVDESGAGQQIRVMYVIYSTIIQYTSTHNGPQYKKQSLTNKHGGTGG